MTSLHFTPTKRPSSMPTHQNPVIRSGSGPRKIAIIRPASVGRQPDGASRRAVAVQ